MCSVLNIAEAIDRMVAEIPGNAKLQIKLGLISLEEEPFEKFHEIMWDISGYKDSLYELASFVANLELSQTGGDDAGKKNLLAEMTSLVSRRLLLRQMVSKKYKIEGIPNDLFKAYAESAEEGWVVRINEIAHCLCLIEGKRMAESEKLAKLFR